MARRKTRMNYDQTYCFEIICLLLQVVYGEVVDGMDLVKKIEGLGSQSGTTKAKIVIAKSGTV